MRGMCDEQVLRALMKLIRRKRLEAQVLRYINEMRAIYGGKPAKSIREACACFCEHEARVARLFPGQRPEPVYAWLARQLRAVILERDGSGKRIAEVNAIERLRTWSL